MGLALDEPNAEFHALVWTGVNDSSLTIYASPTLFEYLSKYGEVSIDLARVTSKGPMFRVSVGDEEEFNC